MVGVLSFGRGLFLRDSIQGKETSYKFFNKIKENHIVLSQLFGWEGALALASKDFEGKYLSPQFPTFTCNTSLVDREFLVYYLKLPRLWEELKSKSKGMGDRRRTINSEALMSCQIPLPALDEQQRIVIRIRDMLDKAEEAQRLTTEILSDLSSLAWSIHDAEPTEYISMRELVSLRPPDVHVDPSEKYHFAGVYSFGRGVFIGQSKFGADFAYPKLTRLRSGDFTYPKLMAWEGALGVVPSECDGLVVSTEFPVFSINTTIVLPEVLDSHFKNPAIWPVIAGDSTGTNVRRRRLNPSDFLDYAFPLPSRTAQEKIAAAWRTRAKLFGQPIRREELAALPASILAQAFAGEL